MDLHIDKKVGVLLGIAVIVGVLIGLLIAGASHNRGMKHGFDKIQNGRMEMRQGKMQGKEYMQNKMMQGDRPNQMMMGDMMPNPETHPNMVPVNAVPVQ
jgi:hypothetical protein